MNIDERGLTQKEINDFSAELKGLRPNQKFNTLKGEIIGQHYG
jgi:hypothetical protein